MQNVTADVNLSADMKAMPVSRKSQGSNKSKPGDQENHQFTEILEQLASLPLPSTMAAREKANVKIASPKLGNNLSKRQTKAMGSGSVSTDLKIPRAKVNTPIGNEAKAKVLPRQGQNGEIPTQKNYPKTQALTNNSRPSDNDKGIDPGSGNIKDKMPEIAGKTFTDHRSATSGKAKTNVNNVNRLTDGAGKGNNPGSRIDQAPADIISAASGKRPTANLAADKPGSSENYAARSSPVAGAEKQNTPGSSPASKVQQVLEPEQMPAPTKKTNTQNYSGAIEKLETPLDLQTVRNQEANGKVVLSKPQLDSIVANMIQQIKVAPSNLELSLKPEYLGKINILVESIEGVVSIKIAAQSGEAAYLLNSSLPSIRENLGEQGVKIHQIEVDLANQEKPDNQKGDREQSKQSSQTHYNQIPGNYSVMGNQEQVYLLPDGLNVWA